MQKRKRRKSSRTKVVSAMAPKGRAARFGRFQVKRRTEAKGHVQLK